MNSRIQTNVTKGKPMKKSGAVLSVFFLLPIFLLSCTSLPESDTSLRDLQSSFRSVSSEVLPAVVEVAVVEIKRQIMPNGDDMFPWDFNPFDQGEGSQEREFRNEGIGSGVIVRRDGESIYVLTNNHVIGEADEIEITLSDNRVFKASIIGKKSASFFNGLP